MNRRRFLTASARIAAGCLLLPWARAWGQSVPPDTSSTVAAWPDLAVARGDAREAARRAIEAIGGMARFVKPGQVVAVKPNASFDAPPEWGATTHPEVLTGVLEACFDAGARRVLVLDHTMVGPERCFERTGTAAAVAAFPKATLISLDQEKLYREVGVPSGKALLRTRIPVALEKADVFINVPTAKSHQATGVSLGLKNLMGLVWDRHTFHNDMDIHTAIADLATVLRPDLTILDAVMILRTGGPNGPGEVIPSGRVIAGTDPVAVDAYGVGLSAWNGRTYRPGQVGYLRHAEKRGLGTTGLETLRIKDVS